VLLQEIGSLLDMCCCFARTLGDFLENGF
jgi:hypothetical protein